MLDTNVLVSAVFFGGIPNRVLQACIDGDHSLVVSPTVYAEYQRIGSELGRRHPRRKEVWESILTHIATRAMHVDAKPLHVPVSDDADDDHFLACALAVRPCLVVSGDKHLLDVSGWNDIEVLTPRQFYDRHIK
ncbi:putative toxin-antitoxin system toxin component, PIN family [Gemmatimonadota bacterium]